MTTIKTQQCLIKYALLYALTLATPAIAGTLHAQNPQTHNPADPHTHQYNPAFAPTIAKYPTLDTKTAPTQNPKPSKQQTTNHNSPADNEPKDNSPMPENNTKAPSIEPFNKQDNTTPSTTPNPNTDKSKNKSQTSTAIAMG